MINTSFLISDHAPFGFYSLNTCDIYAPCSALLSLYVILQPFESVITFERFIFHYLGEHFFKSFGGNQQIELVSLITPKDN